MIFQIFGFISLLFGLTALIFPKYVYQRDKKRKGYEVNDEDISPTELIGIRLAGVLMIGIGIYVALF